MLHSGDAIANGVMGIAAPEYIEASKRHVPAASSRTATEAT